MTYFGPEFRIRAEKAGIRPFFSRDMTSFSPGLRIGNTWPAFRPPSDTGISR